VQNFIKMTIQKPDSFELFQRYLNGNATKEENELMTYWIAKDETFSKQLEEYRVMLSGFDELRIRELEQQFHAAKTEAAPLDLESIEQIERYFNEQLTNDELEAFEYRMLTTPAFKQQVDQYQSVFDGLSTLRVKELEKKLSTASTETIETEKPTINIRPDIKRTEPKTGNIRRLITFAVAAAALVLLLTSLPFLMESDSAKYQRLQAEYSASPRIENLMSANTDETQLMKDGKKAFISKDFDLAMSIFGQIKDNNEAKLYYAHSLFEAGQFEQAAPIYKSLQGAKNSDYRDEADWFLVQCYLMDIGSHKEKLLVVLKRITSTQGTHNYKKKAMELLKELT